MILQPAAHLEGGSLPRPPLTWRTSAHTWLYLPMWLLPVSLSWNYKLRFIYSGDILFIILKTSHAICFILRTWRGCAFVDLSRWVGSVIIWFITFPLVSWVRCGTWLYRFLIFATLLLIFFFGFKIILNALDWNCRIATFWCSRDFNFLKGYVLYWSGK